MKLIIGNKNYSSWSLRPWYLMKVFKIEFEEIRIPLFTPTMDVDIKQFSKAGKVPVLLDGDLIVWDSLAIAEYISEQYLSGRGWPTDVANRAQARACAAEMHSGFFEIRGQLPMNCRAQGRVVPVNEALQQEIERVDEIWSSIRHKNAAQGDWLFGEFSIADSMFVPLAFRFQTYGIALSQASNDYCQSLLKHPAAQLWLQHSKAEKEVISDVEVGK